VDILERRRRIVDELRAAGECTYDRLARSFRVSTMTIRRDIDRLAGAGDAVKTLRGARGVLIESPVFDRLRLQRAEKRAIAGAALGLVGAGQTVFLDGGTTALELARLLVAEPRGLILLTHSAPVAAELGRAGTNAVIGLGGQMDPTTLCFAGPAAEDALRAHRVDLAFFTTLGFVPAEGTYESSLPVIRMKRVAAERAARRVLIVDHTKFGRRAPTLALDSDRIDTVVTDDRTDPKAIRRLERDGKTVLVAPVGRASTRGRQRHRPENRPSDESDVVSPSRRPSGATASQRRRR
jgi:DeoR/GlpR family transcriptional regulator of sugar metabolism